MAGNPDFRVYSSPLAAPEFGTSKWPSGSGVNFLVFPADADLPFVYQPDWRPPVYGFSVPEPAYRYVKFMPSNFAVTEEWGEGLVEGWLSTNSEHPDSLAIFNAFKKSIKKRFEYFRYSGVYVGPEAVKYQESGGRLAYDLRRPRYGDFKRTAPSTPTVE